MKVTTDEDGIVIKEVYSGIALETAEGNQISVCMRDDTLEINVMPGGKHTDNWWRVNMQTGEIEKGLGAVPNYAFDKPFNELNRTELTNLGCHDLPGNLDNLMYVPIRIVRTLPDGTILYDARGRRIVTNKAEVERQLNNGIHISYGVYPEQKDHIGTLVGGGSGCQ